MEGTKAAMHAYIHFIGPLTLHYASSAQEEEEKEEEEEEEKKTCLLYTSPSPRDRLVSRMPSSA